MEKETDCEVEQSKEVVNRKDKTDVVLEKRRALQIKKWRVFLSPWALWFYQRRWKMGKPLKKEKAVNEGSGIDRKEPTKIRKHNPQNLGRNWGRGNLWM